MSVVLRPVHADDKPLFISREGDVPVWVSPEHRAGEQPMHVAIPTEILLREDAQGDYLKVVTQNGAHGWVEAAKVRPYEENDSKIPPEGFYIQRDLTALIIGDNIDRETLERKNGENF